MVGLIKKTLIDSLGVVVIYKHIISKTETRLFHPDALEYLLDDKKLEKLEKSLAYKRRDVIFKI